MCSDERSSEFESSSALTLFLLHVKGGFVDLENRGEPARIGKSWRCSLAQ